MRSIHIKNQAVTRRGFTFIETLVAVTILSLALVGTLTIVSRSVQSSIFSRDQIVAFYLAQEAIEYIQNKRSSNVLEGSIWYAGLDSCNAPNSCAIDVNTVTGNIQIKPSATGCGGSCQPLRFNGTLYNHEPASPSNVSTIFSREVTIQHFNYGIGVVDEEIAVAVTIRWKSGTVDRKLTIRHNLLDWQSVP